MINLTLSTRKQWWHNWIQIELNDCVTQLADGRIEFVGVLDRWWDRLSLWLSSVVSKLLAITYSDAFSVSPVMIQRFPPSTWSPQESHTQPQLPLSAWVLLFLGVCVEIPSVPGSLHQHRVIQRVAGVMLKVRGVRVSRSLPPMSTKYRYLHAD